MFNEIWIFVCKTSLYLAVEKGNIEIVKLLLTNNKLDANLGYIVNNIQNQIIQCNSKSYFLIKFENQIFF